jgi:hypothetical protein
MLFKESDLAINEAANILDKSTYLTEQESLTRVQTVPVVENSRLGAYVVDFSDIERLSEDYGCSYIEAMEAVAEANGIEDPDKHFAVAVDEAAMIEDASLGQELANAVIKPQSETSLAYQFCEACANAYLESGDEQYLGAILEGKVGDAWNAVKGAASNAASTVKGAAASAGNAIDPRNIRDDYQTAQQAGLGKVASAKDALTHNKAAAGVAAGVGVGAVAAGIATARHFIKAAENKPKSWISQKIASLRGIYAKWLKAAQKQSDAGKANVFKQGAAKLMTIIDALLKKLQTAAN